MAPPMVPKPTKPIIFITHLVHRIIKSAAVVRRSATGNTPRDAPPSTPLDTLRSGTRSQSCNLFSLSAFVITETELKVMTTSLGLVSSCKVTVLGSSVMPQIGRSRLRAHDLGMHRANVFGLDRRSGRGRRLQRHTALGARSRLHRNGPQGPLDKQKSRARSYLRQSVDLVCVFVGRRGVFICPALEKFFWVFFEFRQAAMAAEVIGLPIVSVTFRSVAGIHFHAANRINHVRWSNKICL